MSSTAIGSEPGRARVDRWRTSAQVLAEVRAEPGLTRVELARRLALSSASATETVARLREAGWLAEHRAPVTGRGRPTTSLHADPAGPQVLVVDLRHADWRVALAGLDGEPGPTLSGPLPAGADVVDVLRAAATALESGEERPVVAVGVAAPAPLAGDAFVRAHEMGWTLVEPAGLRAAFGDVPVLPGNDATLAGLAEARTGAALGAATALYLTVEVGVGGTLLLDGRPHTGRHGAAGEFGHMPFGDPAQVCSCGARGCWGTVFDGRSLARTLGADPPDDPRAFAAAVLDRDDAPARAAIRSLAEALGRGAAGLVNAHDPDVVVLGGLAPRLRGAAFAAAFEAGLMDLHRHDPPPIRDAVHGADGTLRGAAALALDRATSAEGLAAREQFGLL